MTSSIRVRRATPEDEKRVLEWKNDPDTRAASFNPEEISAAAHHRWYRARLDDDRCVMCIVEDQGMPIGNVRFSIEEPGVAEVHIALDREFRSKGLSVPAMRIACALATREARLRTIRARVRRWNEPSMRLFRSAGFVEESQEQTGPEEAAIFWLDTSLIRDGVE